MINKIKYFFNNTIEGFIFKIIINIFLIFLLLTINLWFLNQSNTIQNYIGMFNLVLTTVDSFYLILLKFYTKCLFLYSCLALFIYVKQLYLIFNDINGKTYN